MQRYLTTRAGRKILLNTPAEDAAINAGIEADPDTQEVTAEMAARMRPFHHRGKPVTHVHLNLAPSFPGAMLGSRATAQPYRERLETAWKSGAHVVLDFDGHDATQGFVDELVGLLVLRHGRTVISRIEFRGCTSTVQEIVRFVLADRAAQYAQAQ